VVNKEVRRNLLCNINIIENEVSFKNIILDYVNIHNNNINEIYEEVITKKIYKILEKEDKDFYLLNEGNYFIIKGGHIKLERL